WIACRSCDVIDAIVSPHVSGRRWDSCTHSTWPPGISSARTRTTSAGCSTCLATTVPSRLLWTLHMNLPNGSAGSDATTGAHDGSRADEIYRVVVSRVAGLSPSATA